MHNFNILTFHLLFILVSVSCTPSIQEYIFPSTTQPCLLHLVLQKRQEGKNVINREFKFESLIFQQFRNLVLLTSSYTSINDSNVKQDDDDETDNGQSSLSSSSRKSLVIGSKWRGGSCFRFFVYNAQSFLDVLQDPQIMFWGNSEFPEIIAFVPTNHGRGWSQDSIVGSKEAGHFNGFRANLVIVVWKSDAYYSSIGVQKLGFLCYMCPRQNSVQWMTDPPFQQGVKEVYKKLRRNGYKRKFYLKQGEDKSNYEEDRNCEGIMFFQKTKDCGITTVLLQMTKSALNLTMEQVGDLDDVDSPISVNAIILGEISSDIATLGNDRIVIFFRDQTIGKLFYCTDSETFEPVSWNFFFRVVEPSIWSCIFCLGIVYAIITRSPYLGIRALLFLVGQGIPAQLSRKKILLTPLFPLILVSNWYISILTMDVVVPPAIWVVTKNKQLFDLGFKFLIPSLSSLPVVRRIGNRSMEKFGIPWDPNYFIASPEIAHFGQELQPEFLIKLGAINGIYHTNVDFVRYMRRLKLLSPRNSRYANVTCSVVEEDWDDQIKYFWVVGGYLGPQVVQIASRFVASGFNRFWTAKKHLNTVSNMQISRYCLTHSQVCGSEDVKKMAMHSSIQIIFYFLLALAVVSSFIFGFEIINGRKTRNKIVYSERVAQ